MSFLTTDRYKSSMLLERIKTSLWLPKIIFCSTIVLGLMTIGLAYAYIAISPAVFIEDALKITDQLTYKVIVNHGIIDSGSVSDTLKATVIGE